MVTTGSLKEPVALILRGVNVDEAWIGGKVIAPMLKVIFSPSTYTKLPCESVKPLWVLVLYPMPETALSIKTPVRVFKTELLTGGVIVDTLLKDALTLDELTVLGTPLPPPPPPHETTQTRVKVVRINLKVVAVDMLCRDFG